jgi:hypothetical protein
VFQSLGPGMQDSQEAQFGSETFGIGGQFQKSLRHGPEQNPIDDSRVLQGQWRQFMRQSEHHMTIGHLCVRAHKFPNVALPVMWSSMVLAAAAVHLSVLKTT